MATKTSDKTATPAAPATTDAPKKAPRYIAITMTPELLKAIEDARKDVPAGTFLQRIVAKELNVTITAKQSNRGKYAGLTKDQKKAAVKADKVKQAKLVEMMMEKYAADMEALQAELEARMKKEAEQAATPAAA